tara:strand:- start:352 stop:522 length:171 start_codon:yes stop_codon:yes gene_type:complete
MMEEFDEHINDLYEDMERLNALYEELCWDHTVRLEFSIDSNEHDGAFIKIKPVNIK